MLDALADRVNRYRVGDLAITYCNVAWAAQYDVEPNQAIGRSLLEFLSPDEQLGLRTQLAKLGPQLPMLVDPIARAAPNAPGQWLEWIDRYLDGPDGPEVLSIGRDVTERCLAEQRLAESESRFRELADSSSDIVWHFISDPAPHFDYVSPSVEAILGYPAHYFLSDFDHVFDVLDPLGSQAIRGVLDGQLSLESFDFRVRHADGSLVVCETRTTRVRDGLQGVCRDVTEIRRLQDKLAALALRDPLTGLANRRLLDELLDAELARTQQSGTALGVAYIDLDGLKQVNDTFGHDAGDVVLREVARRLGDVVGGADVVARVGGDEFVVLFHADDAASTDLADRIDAALAQPISLDDERVVVCPASVGTADTHSVGGDSSGLLAGVLAAADEAMYARKRARRNRSVAG